MTGGLPYRNREEAGARLAGHVKEVTGEADAVVLALPRGGVPVGFGVARALSAPLVAFPVRKLGVPGHAELAMGAVAAHGVRLLDEPLIAELRLDSAQVAAAVDRETAEMIRRDALYRKDLPETPVRNRSVVLVDDGLATGFTMRAAVAAIRSRGPRRIIVAVPVGAPETCRALAREVGALICLLRPDPFHAVGHWYRDFRPTTDDEVRAYLLAATNRDLTNC